MAMSVNMLRFQVAIDLQPRSKNGHPAHSTTGVLKTSCSQACSAGPSHASTGTPSIGNMAKSSAGRLQSHATFGARSGPIALHARAHGADVFRCLRLGLLRGRHLPDATDIEDVEILRLSRLLAGQKLCSAMFAAKIKCLAVPVG